MGASFTRGTTPDYRFEVTSDLSDWDYVYLSLGQCGKELVRIVNPTVTPTNNGCVITGTLTQEQTLRFDPGEGEAQLRCFRNGVAAASSILSKFMVNQVIMNGKIPKGRS